MTNEDVIELARKSALRTPENEAYIAHLASEIFRPTLEQIGVDIGMLLARMNRIEQALGLPELVLTDER